MHLRAMYIKAVYVFLFCNFPADFLASVVTIASIIPILRLKTFLVWVWDWLKYYGLCTQIIIFDAAWVHATAIWLYWIIHSTLQHCWQLLNTLLVKYKIGSLNPGPGHSQIFSTACEIKSESGLGSRLWNWLVHTFTMHINLISLQISMTHCM